MGNSYRRDTGLSISRHELIDRDPPRCAECSRVIPKPRRYKQRIKYCDDVCAQKAVGRQSAKNAARRKARTETLRDREMLYDADQTRRGPTYDSVLTLMPARLVDPWVDNVISDAEFRREYQTLTGRQTTPQEIGMVRRAIWNDRATGELDRTWKMKPALKKMLGPSDLEAAALARTDPEAYEKTLDDLVDAFVAWRDRFFHVSYGTKYITRPMHRRWIRTILDTIYTGGRSLILSPPRHGKTDLLIHFCVWLILRNPDIRILWVGPNSDIAELALGQVRELLGTHAELAQAYLAPSQSWKPFGRTGVWAQDKFTVANRKTVLKQPTMWCAGVESKILSLDADFIVVDDPADPETSYTQGGREKTLTVFRQRLITRKMNHTGMAVISSRVHPDDLYAYLIDSSNWNVVVDRAHDSGICGLDLYEDHDGLADPEACVLFPEHNPLPYLREQAEDVGMALFEMMYLNEPRPDGTAIFHPETIRAKCLDASRDVGIDQLPVSYRLVAGLDPAARGVQASFLWAVTMPNWTPGYDPEDPRYEGLRPSYVMVDMETQQAGGIEGALSIIADWHDRYRCDIWVIEDNAYQSVFFDDPRAKTLAAERSLTLRPTHTGRNKHDPFFGVSGMAPIYHDGEVVLPYATPEAMRKTDALIRQLVNFTGETARNRSSKQLSDILMASWFPFAELIGRWRRENQMLTKKMAHREGFSYPNYAAPTYDRVPWGKTGYFTRDDS